MDQYRITRNPRLSKILALISLIGHLSHAQGSKPVAPAPCSELILKSEGKASEPYTAFLTEREKEFRKKFAFVEDTLQTAEHKHSEHQNAGRQNYYRLLITTWLANVQRSTLSETTDFGFRRSHFQGTSVSESWGLHRQMLVRYLSGISKQEMIPSLDVMNAAWWVTSFLSFSKLPDSDWKLTRSGLPLLPVSLDELLSDADQSFLRHSRIGRQIKLVDHLTRSGTKQELDPNFSFIPIIETVNSIDMNYLFINRELVMGTPMTNLSVFDEIESYSASVLAHDDIHAYNTLRTFGSKIGFFIQIYHLHVEPITDPYRRRIMEYLYWSIWHEEYTFSRFLLTSVNQANMTAYQNINNTLAYEALRHYMKYEMDAHGEVNGPEPLKIETFIELADVLTDAMKLPRLQHRPAKYSISE